MTHRPGAAGLIQLAVALDSFNAGFKALCTTLPDRRRGENTVYDMTDICMAAFSVFFMQSPSFLALQTALQRGRGTSNCQTLFGMERIPTDNHIRTMLDPVPPEMLFPKFDTTLGRPPHAAGHRWVPARKPRTAVGVAMIVRQSRHAGVPFR
jgi:hypothetical protein